jgi:glucose dehydrogenase
MAITGPRAVMATLIFTAVFASAAHCQDDGQWTRPGKDFGATRFSNLAEITAANVGQLRPTWTFSTGVLGGHEGQPLVAGETMYVVTPYPNVLYAFDLSEQDYCRRRDR